MSDTVIVEETPSLDQHVGSLAALAKAGDVRAFNAAREAQLRGEDPPVVAAPAAADAPAIGDPAAGDEPAAVDPNETADAKAARLEAEAEAKASEAGRTLNEQKNRKKSRADELREEIDALTYRKHRAREAAEAEEARAAAALEAQRKPAAKADPAADTFDPGPEPKEEDFPDYRSYVRAEAKREARIAAHEAEVAAEQKIEARLKARDDEAAQRAQGQQFDRAREAFEAKRVAFAAQTPDYEEIKQGIQAKYGDPAYVMNDDIGLHVQMSEVGPELAYTLAKMALNDHKEFRRIADLPLRPMLAALGRLEGKILDRAASHPPASTPARNPVKPAVKPISPVGSSATVTAIPSHELVKTDPKQWMKQRDQDELKRRGLRR